ncbi:hypothetical protein L288_07935 [Sphingobium quisquiliarum P25]|uniref:Uncharacterized protein n=1 Tax=Sphingobium quisquiliarum P25 TaxID=1329909 RepID=T0H5L2_9SPHN|nr:hypothetical protein L288_07935 [Sphingobium quisquiliarum P25]
MKIVMPAPAPFRSVILNLLQEAFNRIGEV